jgi:predicted RNase H-like HicB family nuclease
MSELRSAGIPLQRIRRAINWLGRALPRIAAPLADLTLVTDGKRIFYLSPNPGKLVDVLAGGQLVFNVSLGGWLREVAKELPRDERTEAVQYDLPEVVEPGESGYFVGHCPVLRGCVAQGRTREEAQANLKRAIASYLAVLEEIAQEEAARRGDRVVAAHT